MKEYIIHNALIVNELSVFHGAVHLKEGVIYKIYYNNVFPQYSGVEYIDASQQYLLPGIIDDQVHFREPGLTHKADFLSESRAAIAGGVTTVMDMPNVNPPTTSIVALEQKYEMIKNRSFTNYSLYLGATNDNIDEILSLEKGQTCGVKIFMGSSTGNMLVDNKDTLDKIFSKSKQLIAVHCEDEETIKNNASLAKEKYGEDVPISEHPKIRNVEACYKSSSMAVELAMKYNTKLHVLHITTERELSLFSNLALGQKNITAEVCVHHLWFTDNDYEKLGSLIKCNPAVKSETDRNALRMALKTNKLDVVATDHAPHTLQEKANSYFKSPSGLPLVQHSLQMMMELVNQNIINIEELVYKMCHAPSLLFAIQKRGFIREGYFADIVLLDTNRIYTISKENVLYKCGWSPLENSTLQSTVTHTWVNGFLVYEHGKPIEDIKGQRLLFDF